MIQFFFPFPLPRSHLLFTHISLSYTVLLPPPSPSAFLKCLPRPPHASCLWWGQTYTLHNSYYTMCTYVPKMCYFMWYGFPPVVPSTKHESSRSVTCKHGDFVRLQRGFRTTSLKSWDLFLMIPMNESAFILTRKWDLWRITRLLPSAYFNYKTGEIHGHLPESLAVSGYSYYPTKHYTHGVLWTNCSMHETGGEKYPDD